MDVAPPPKKRPRVVVHQTSVICRLPEDLVLHIFGYLDVSSLITCSLTCRVWYRLSGDRKLWRQVDLTPYKVDTKGLWKFVRQHCSDKLKLLSLRGSAVDLAKPGKKKNVLLTRSLVEEIDSRCSNLETLRLFNCDLRDVPLTLFPTRQLETLHLHNCILSSNWFQVEVEVRSRKRSVLPRLRNLNLHQSTMIARNDLIQISRLTQLTHLDLSQCYRVDDVGLMAVCKGVRGIVDLNISGCTKITDNSMHKLCRHLNQLKILRMKNVFRVTDLGISCIANTLSHLDLLDISQCTAVTDAAVLEVANKLSQLKELNVSLCHHVTQQCLDTVAVLLPSCECISVKQQD